MAKIHHYKAHAEVKKTGHLHLSTLRRWSITILRERSLSKIQSFFFWIRAAKLVKFPPLKFMLKKKTLVFKFVHTKTTLSYNLHIILIETSLVIFYSSSYRLGNIKNWVCSLLRLMKNICIICSYSKRTSSINVQKQDM